MTSSSAGGRGSGASEAKRGRPGGGSARILPRCPLVRCVDVRRPAIRFMMRRPDEAVRPGYDLNSSSKYPEADLLKV